MSIHEKLARLEELRRRSKEGGGEERLSAQHSKGKLSARERLKLLLDEGSFTELDRFVTHRSVDFGLDEKKILGDGVVTGYGTIHGRWYMCSARTLRFLVGHCPKLMLKKS